MILGLFHSVIYVALITCFILTQLYNDKFSYGDEGVDEDQSPIDNQTVTEDQGTELEEKMKQAGFVA
ncbi:MAG: hypothetical protein ACR5K9_06435 [Wolbachia sp.]